MIHTNAIKRRADEDGLGASAVERDYVLAHVLAAIVRGEGSERIVFKGGTALRLCHFERYRYSADLDFSLIGGLDVEAAKRRLIEDWNRSASPSGSTTEKPSANHYLQADQAILRNAMPTILRFRIEVHGDRSDLTRQVKP